MTEDKPWKSFPEQLEILKNRGLLVFSRSHALRGNAY